MSLYRRRRPWAKVGRPDRGDQLHTLPNEDVSIGFWLEPVNHVKVDLPVAHLPVGCRDERQVIDHHVMPTLMAMRFTSLQAFSELQKHISHTFHINYIHLRMRNPTKTSKNRVQK